MRCASPLLVCLLALCAPAAAQTLRPCRLVGPGGTVALPAREPVVVHVFEPGSRAAHKAFEALARLRADGADFPYAEVYAAVTAAGQQGAPVLEDLAPLVYDPGGEVLQRPHHLGAFTTVIVDPRGFLIRVGQPYQWGYMGRIWTTAESLQEAWETQQQAAEQAGRVGPRAAGRAPAGAARQASPAPPPPPGASVGWLAAPALCALVLIALLATRARSGARRRLAAVLEHQPGLRCGGCLERLRASDAVVACPACMTVSHRACLAERGCSTSGCPGAGAPAGRTP